MEVPKVATVIEWKALFVCLLDLLLPLLLLLPLPSTTTLSPNAQTMLSIRIISRFGTNRIELALTVIEMDW